RRRHTRSYGDWGSHVCSSDLTSAAGKCLTRWDLPLAADEPSPPNPSGLRLGLGRLRQDPHPLNQLPGARLPEVFRARLEFVARTHRKGPSMLVTKFWSHSH